MMQQENKKDEKTDASSQVFLSHSWFLLFLSQGQMITTFQCNTSQHVEHFWPPCCDMLGVVEFEPTTPNMLQQGGQTCAACCLCCVEMLLLFGRGFII